MMNDGQSTEIGMSRYAVRPPRIDEFLATHRVTARQLVSVEVFADQIVFGLIPDTAFEVPNQAGLIIHFEGREAISSIVRAGGGIFFKATETTAKLPWIPNVIRRIAEIPGREPGDEPATDMYFGAPIEAAMVQFSLLPDNTIEVLNPVQGQGVICVRFIKFCDILLAIALNSRSRGVGLTWRVSTDANTRDRAQVWQEVTQAPDRHEILFLGRPRSTMGGRIQVPVTFHGGTERMLTLFMDGDRPSDPRWSDPRTTMRRAVGVVHGMDTLRASFVPDRRSSILRLERV